MLRPRAKQSFGLYIHLPWCERKCPYCDFNSHVLPGGGSLPESLYVRALIRDFRQAQDQWAGRTFTSVFFGGGTPSLFSAQSIEAILKVVGPFLSDGCEITLEANPQSVEIDKFADYYQAGINRLSIGIQSFNDEMLTRIGRLHNAKSARSAIEVAQKVGFDRFNVDIMYGLPSQTLELALYDLEVAFSYNIQHLSWYQLTLEPNTLFASRPPPLPHEELLADIEQAGRAKIGQYGLKRYEVSAYSIEGHQSRHNLNYWNFGDYIGIGAGSYSKCTVSGQVWRWYRQKRPNDYMLEQPFLDRNKQQITGGDLAYEFMLNACRLTRGFDLNEFESRTGLLRSDVQAGLNRAIDLGLLIVQEDYVVPTSLGQDFVNESIQLFSPQD